MPLVNYADYVTRVSYADARKRSSEISAETPEVIDIFSEAMQEMNRSIVEEAERKGRDPEIDTTDYSVLGSVSNFFSFFK